MHERAAPTRERRTRAKEGPYLVCGRERAQTKGVDDRAGVQAAIGAPTVSNARSAWARAVSKAGVQRARTSGR